MKGNMDSEQEHNVDNEQCQENEESVQNHLDEFDGLMDGDNTDSDTEKHFYSSQISNFMNSESPSQTMFTQDYRTGTFM